MKTYTVYFSEPVCHKYIGGRFNRELKNGSMTWNVRNGTIHSHSTL